MATERRPHTARHTPAQWLVLGVNVLVVLACLGGAAGLMYGKRQAEKRLQTPRVAIATTTTQAATSVPGGTTGPTETFPTADPQAQNFLITGEDSHPCVAPNSPYAGAADPARSNLGSRSDTIMVMRVDPSKNQAAILSFPRDLWVSIPNRGKGRINTAYVKDDYSLLAQTLYDNFGVKIDHYLQINFCAFKRIIDAVGGVGLPFDLEAFKTPAIAIRDPHVGIKITRSGCHLMHGDEALAYARSRHLAWVDQNGVFHEDRLSDFSRISRQQDLLRRVLQRALDRGLYNPSVARAIITSLQTDIVTESGFTINDMLKFAGVMRNVQTKGIRTYQVEAGLYIVNGQMAVKAYDTPNMTSIFNIFQGKAPMAAAPTQVFATSTTVGGVYGKPTTTSSSSTTTTTTIAGSTTTGVKVPDEVIKADIMPVRGKVCN
jgi:LCP family protein required for cell wall assembly